MARFAAWVVAYGMALFVAARTTGGVPGLLWFLFWLAIIPSAFYYLFRFVGIFKQRVLWSLRRRLIVTYLFIAVVPILLIVLLVALGSHFVNGQFASFLVASKLRDRADVLHQLDRMIAHQANLLRPGTPQVMLDELHNTFISALREHSSSYPGLSLTLRLGALVRASSLDDNAQPNPVTVPTWLRGEKFSGIVADQGELALRAVDRRQTKLGELIVIISQPLTPELLDQVGAGIGPVGLLTPQKNPPVRMPERAHNPAAQASASEGVGLLEVSATSKSVQIPEPAFWFDFTVFGDSSLDPVLWESDQEQRQADAGRIVVTSRIIALNRQLFTQLGHFSGILPVAFMVIAVFFLLIELLALVVGIQLTRSMTTTVDKLYLATERVKAGDFSHRVNLPAQDQLSALGEAFDGMAASVESLVRESLEKTRLEGELEIAREVQSQLFPQKAPEVSGLKLYGVCKPARVVSGDYYDYLRLNESRVGLVVGDISGKGISAALLMASVQSALHAQFYNGHSPAGTGESALLSSAEVVGRLNRQLYASTPLEKYATFFYAVYDGGTRDLIYTNAGHPPPFLFHRGKIERLNTGGTVVGMFNVVQYDQGTIHLEPGDMLLAFTDGITEPENSYGEEFGEGRLLEVARRAANAPPEQLVEEIYRTVSDWTGSPELQDDMTLVVARAIE